jgi:hypothetical protein
MELKSDIEKLVTIIRKKEEKIKSTESLSKNIEIKEKKRDESEDLYFRLVEDLSKNLLKKVKNQEIN